MKTFTALAGLVALNSFASAVPFVKRAPAVYTQLDTVVVTITTTLWVDENGNPEQPTSVAAPPPSSSSLPFSAAAQPTIQPSSTANSGDQQQQQPSAAQQSQQQPSQSQPQEQQAPSSSSSSQSQSEQAQPTIQSSSSQAAPPLEPTSTSTTEAAYVTPPTPTPEPTTSSYNAPPPPAATPGGGSTGGTTNYGDFTWYSPFGAPTACGKTINSNSAHIVAIGAGLFDKHNVGTNPNNNPLCGKTVTIIGKTGQTFTAEIVDRCEACTDNDLDLTELFLQEVIPGADGREKGSWILNA